MVGLILFNIVNVWAGGERNSATKTPEKSNKLVIYTSSTEEYLNMTVPAFESKYGIKVEIIAASGGELINRLNAEKDAPIADILLGGGKSALANFTPPVCTIRFTRGTILGRFR
ncbi:hypothetical protein AGMMS49574_26770 [Bacteroidia bacterium]|nr:hypothetical protein AGMMS49574_26770 [Bacteroidia bacterium]